MTNKKSTKRALLLSVLSLLLCVSMLIGSTFAWFTDSVTSGNNIIKSGNLDVQLFHASKNVAEEEVTASTTNMFKDVALWEPGAMVWEKLTVKNNGSLALQYALNLNVLAATEVDGHSLTEVLKVAVLDAEPTRDNIKNAALMDLASFVAKSNRPLNPAASESFYVAIYWAPTANDNDYNVPGEALNVTLGVNLVATQYTKETDSFDDQYDVLAQGGYTSAPAPTSGWEEYTVYAGNSNVKTATMLIDAAAVEDADLPIAISIVPTVLNENVTVTDEQDAATYEITVSNLKEGNTSPIKVQLYVGTGKTGVQIYHHGNLIPSDYDPNSGYASFETTSFSPYTVVFDAVAKEEEPADPDEHPLPQANVVKTPEHENVDLPWGSYGGVAPTPGLDSYLEAAYTFSCKDTIEEAQASAYADWYCDFYVKLDKDLGENQIFLGGNYGAFGWVGFHNGDLTLEANTEIPLLGSVTQNPWTYSGIASFVNTFICGVGDVNDALAGATFTVMLRLTNPENEDEYYDVATIEHTFTESTQVSSADQLVDAVADGATNIKLAGDIEMVGQKVTVPAGSSVVLNLNGHDIVGTSQSAEGVELFSVNGELKVLGEGTISLTNEDYAWTESYRYTPINIRETGVVTLGKDVSVVCETGDGMGYAVDIYTTGTLTVNGADLYSSYIAVRCFYGAATVNVNSGSSITAGKNNYGIWPQEAADSVITIADGINYTVEEDFGIYIFD